MNEVFNEYARYYDALYADKDYGQEASYIDELIQQHSKISVGNILEFGAGSGKLQRELRGLGYDVTSVDLSPEMVEQAKNSGVAVELGDIRNHTLDGKFDAVVAFFHVISYLTSDRDLEMGISNALAHLKPGGVFIFDVWFKDAVLAQKPEVRVKRAIHEGIEIVRIAEPAWGKSMDTVEVNYQLFAKEEGKNHFESVSEKHLLRFFSTDELLALGSDYGAAPLLIEETLTKLAPSRETWGVTEVLRLEKTIR